MAGLEPAMVAYWAVLKALVFSLTSATVACSIGLRTRGGALGVGNASRDTVVWSFANVPRNPTKGTCILTTVATMKANSRTDVNRAALVASADVNLSSSRHAK
jgi:ABC-type transporter Mla maintaining outer membrane lipid asymmetry permease subunit MlaE